MLWDSDTPLPSSEFIEISVAIKDGYFSCLSKLISCVWSTKIGFACLFLLQTEDYLKRKIRSRPERSELVRMHILEGTAHMEEEDTNNKICHNYLLAAFSCASNPQIFPLVGSGQNIMLQACGVISWEWFNNLWRISYVNSDCTVLHSWATVK